MLNLFQHLPAFFMDSESKRAAKVLEFGMTCFLSERRACCLKPHILKIALKLYLIEELILIWRKL